ncbi:hypothetical protein D9611_014907 [Ephemerocybe angulata]|uniref:Uncharacterized protein n=1 Tax=Ephemerocybe angulata TaxID=980116 RepID=A0A8H5ER18_9AGAR|nr:hypothetical protein D9611_014907 [Tulosesus angulatus]
MDMGDGDLVDLQESGFGWGRGIYKEDAPRFYSAFPPFLPHFPLSIAASSLRSHSPPALLIVLYTPPSSSPTATSPAHHATHLRSTAASSSSSSHTTNSPYRLFIDPLARLPFAHIYSASLLPRFASLPTTTIFLLPSLPLVVVGDVLGISSLLTTTSAGLCARRVRRRDSKRSRRTSSMTSSSASQSPSSLAVSIKTTVKWSRRRPILFLRPVVAVGAALQYAVVVEVGRCARRLRLGREASAPLGLARVGMRAHGLEGFREGLEDDEHDELIGRSEPVVVVVVVVGVGRSGFQTTARWDRARRIVKWVTAVRIPSSSWVCAGRVASSSSSSVVVVMRLLRDRDEMPGRGGRRMGEQGCWLARVSSSSSLRAKVWAGVGFELNVSAFRCCVSVEDLARFWTRALKTSGRLILGRRGCRGHIVGLRGGLYEVSARRRPAQSQHNTEGFAVPEPSLAFRFDAWGLDL